MVSILGLLMSFWFILLLNIPTFIVLSRKSPCYLIFLGAILSDFGINVKLPS